MRKIIKLFIFVFGTQILCSCITFPKDNILDMDVSKGKLDIPNLDGYITLKADLHIHTVFSDGSVTYIDRVTEAYREDLDVIAITDHNHYRFALTKLPLFPARNRLWESAQAYAKEKDIILIKGLELTRIYPPGHFNAIFLTNIKKFNHIFIKGNLREAKKQNAFVFWNHLYQYKLYNEGSLLRPIHKKMLEEDLFYGIELNGRTYDEAFELCLENNLTVIVTTDSHLAFRIFSGTDHRNMTLIFARDKTPEAVHEALKERRTAAYIGENIFGEEKYLKELFEKAVSISFIQTGNSAAFTFKNNSDLIFRIGINKADENVFTINPQSQASITVELIDDTKNDKVRFYVNNFRIGPGKEMEYIVELE